MPRKFSFPQFVALIKKIGEEKKLKSDFNERLDRMGRDFSLITDGGFDSLDTVELVMRLEELMWELPDFDKNYKIPDDVGDDAKNIGQFYDNICKSL